ncbi:alpha/beta hydrolase [Sphingomonas sp.]|uniref:alpha/beta hydrolase n=1 Tax=Sphingomonas sp. TaxID=28214 RepID=UPI0025F2202C|nr:alpha/beta hydrolase [Sphingomonas sp.]
MRVLTCFFALFALLAGGTAAEARESETIKLFPNGAPGSMGPMQPETTADQPPFGHVTRNVSHPTLTVFAPDPKIATGTAVIIAPGGGFHLLSIENEGTGVAAWLNSLGITAFVLRYRLLPTGDDFGPLLMRRLMNFSELEAAIAPLRPLATADGEEAVRYLRANAAQFGVKPDRVGMMGFSAGGAVATWTALAAKADSRPDFVVAMYPGLVGGPLAVPAKAPPLLAMVADDDPIVRPESDRLVKAWQAAGADATLVTFASGGHGFGIAKSGKASDAWTARAQSWFEAKGLLRK